MAIKTVSDLTEKWKETVERNKGDWYQTLWCGAAMDIVRVLENNTPETALTELRKLRKNYRQMAISMWYAGAANDLSRIIRNEKRKTA